MAVDSRLGLGIKLLDLEADNELFLSLSVTKPNSSISKSDANAQAAIIV